MGSRHQVTLRYPTYGDYASFFEMRFAPEVVYWADDAPHGLSLDEYALGRMASQEAGECIERIIVVDDAPVGTVTARDFCDSGRQCTLGIVIADSRYWGRGCGHDALRMFMVLLAQEGVCRLFLETYANNRRAQRCFHRIGFQKRRVFYSPLAGRYVVQMSMKLTPVRPIGEVVSRDDPRWRAPR